MGNSNKHPQKSLQCNKLKLKINLIYLFIYQKLEERADCRRLMINSLILGQKSMPLGSFIEEGKCNCCCKIIIVRDLCICEGLAPKKHQPGVCFPLEISLFPLEMDWRYGHNLINTIDGILLHSHKTLPRDSICNMIEVEPPFPRCSGQDLILGLVGWQRDQSNS